jgi:hypothetical protein
MNTFTIITEETPAPEVTQAKERIFIHDLPVTYTAGLSAPIQALYQNAAPYGKRHYITLGDIKELVVSDSEISPNRSLTDEEMIAYLNQELYAANEEAETYKKRTVRLLSDIGIIAEALRNEAENREWCDEYNQFCDKVNSKTEEHHLLSLEQEYEVEVEVTATVITRATLSVMASSRDLAEEMVIDDPDSFFDPNEEALSEVKMNGFDDYDVTLG